MVKKTKENAEEEKDRGLGDILKKITSIGMGAAFLTEDTIKSVIGDMPLPKDITAALIQNAKNAKAELLTSLGNEFRDHLAKLETKEIADYIAKNYDVSINVSFSAKEKEKNEDGEQ